jgi:hypothetical protein
MLHKSAKIYLTKHQFRLDQEYQEFKLYAAMLDQFVPS